MFCMQNMCDTTGLWPIPAEIFLFLSTAKHGTSICGNGAQNVLHNQKQKSYFCQSSWGVGLFSAPVAFSPGRCTILSEKRTLQRKLQMPLQRAYKEHAQSSFSLYCVASSPTSGIKGKSFLGNRNPGQICALAHLILEIKTLW